MATFMKTGAKWKVAIVAGCFAGVFGVTSAQAVILIQGNNPQPNEQNVILGGDETGNPVFGNLNQTGQTFRFGSNENLIEPSAGQARIAAVDGSFNVLTIAPDAAGANFQDAIFNIQLTGNGPREAFAEITVDVLNGAPTSFTNVPLGQGQNFLTIVAGPGERLTGVQIEVSSEEEGVAIQDVRQIRISGVADCPTCPPARVPEPGTLALLGGSLLGFVGFTARRLRRR